MTIFKKGDRAKRVGRHILAGHPTQEFNEESRRGDTGTISYTSDRSENAHIEWDRTGRQSAIDPASLVPMRNPKVGDLWAWDGPEENPAKYDHRHIRITDVTLGRVYYEYPSWAEPRTEFDRSVWDFLDAAHYVSSPEPEFKTGDTVEALRDTESEFGAEFPRGTQGTVNRPVGTPRHPDGSVPTFRDKPGLVVDDTPQGDGFIVNPADWAVVTPTKPEPPTPEFQAGDKVLVTANTEPYHYLEFGEATVVEPEYPSSLGTLRVEGASRDTGDSIRQWVSPLDLTPADPAPAKAAKPEFKVGQVWTYVAMDVKITEVTDTLVKYQYVDGSGFTYAKPHDTFDRGTRGRLVKDAPQDTLPTRPGSAVLAGGVGHLKGKHVVPLFLTTKGEWVTKYGANFGWSNALIKERGFTVLHDQDTVKED